MTGACRPRGRWGGAALALGLILAIGRPGAGAAQNREPQPAGSELRVYLMTMGPGSEVWERFGHNAIWIDDPSVEPDTAYNYGLFDFRQENFLLRFIRGQMWYWMAGFPAQPYVETYVHDNRSVWLQEINLPPAARLDLRNFLRWNERPQHRFYHYDYYRDNCSTRVRDALDRVIGGAIKAQTQSLPTGTTYRFHTQRLTSNDPLVFTGLLLALGEGVDRPISAWEEMFLPMAMREHVRQVTIPGEGGARVPLVSGERTLFESSAPLPPVTPPSWLLWYLALGAAIGSLAVILGVRAGRGASGRMGLGVVVAGWGILGGLGGLILTGLWAFTDHAMAYRNENVLQLNPLVLALGILGPLALVRARWARGMALALANVVVLLSVAGLMIQALPGVDQVNGAVIALALPIHLGVALGLRRGLGADG